MIKKKKRIPFLLLMLLSCLPLFTLTECRDDLLMEEGEGKPQDPFSVSILLAGMGEESTRGAGEDCEDTDGVWGNAFENYIDVEDLYIMTFSIEEGTTGLTAESKVLEVLWNGKRKGKPTDTSIYFDGSRTYLYTWLDKGIEAYKPEEGKDKNFCIVAVANFSKYELTKSVKITPGMKYSDLQGKLRYNFSNAFVEGKHIPLFGVKRVNLKGYDSKVFNAGNPYPLRSPGGDTLWMLRAFSKVEVALGEDLLAMQASAGEITITSATVNRSAADFWVTPELDRMSGFATTGGTGQVTVVPAGAGPSVNETTLPFSVSAEGKSAVVYLPEFELTDADRPKVTLNLNIGANPETFEFEVRKYSDEPQAYDGSGCWKYLLRNHCYRFSIGVGFRIVSVNPQDWTYTFDNDFYLG